VPRIDRKVIQQYKEDIIALSEWRNPNKIFPVKTKLKRPYCGGRTVPGRLLYGGDVTIKRMKTG
jgi:hypothetical protein